MSANVRPGKVLGQANAGKGGTSPAIHVRTRARTDSAIARHWAAVDQVATRRTHRLPPRLWAAFDHAASVQARRSSEVVRAVLATWAEDYLARHACA